MSDRLNGLPQLDIEPFRVPDAEQLRPASPSTHPPRLLLLYGSLRERSLSRLVYETKSGRSPSHDELNFAKPPSSEHENVPPR